MTSEPKIQNLNPSNNSLKLPSTRPLFPFCLTKWLLLVTTSNHYIESALNMDKLSKVKQYIPILRYLSKCDEPAD